MGAFSSFSTSASCCASCSRATSTALVPADSSPRASRASRSSATFICLIEEVSTILKVYFQWSPFSACCSARGGNGTMTAAGRQAFSSLQLLRTLVAAGAPLK